MNGIEINTLFSAPKPPPRDERPLPTRRDPSVRAEEERSRIAALRRRGSRSNIRTGPQGDTSTAPVLVKQLGGRNEPLGGTTT